MSVAGAEVLGWGDLIAEMPYGLVLYDSHGVVVATNERAADLLDLSRSALTTAATPADWSLCDDSGASLPRLSDLARQVARARSSMTMPVVVTRSRTPLRQLWADLHPVNLHVLVVFRPVEAAPSRTLLDPTTDLPHRALLFDRIEQTLARARVHATNATLVLADLRGLASVNAEHGFDTGDALLALVAARLRRGLREDHTVARYTGGTFAVVSEHSAPSGAAIAARVAEIVTEPALVNGHVLHPRVRTGWVTCDGTGTVHRLVSEAERRLR